MTLAQSTTVPKYNLSAASVASLSAMNLHIIILHNLWLDPWEEDE